MECMVIRSMCKTRKHKDRNERFEYRYSWKDGAAVEKERGMKWNYIERWGITSGWKEEHKMNITCVCSIYLLYLSMWQKLIPYSIYPNIMNMPFSNRVRRLRIYTHKMEGENTMNETGGGLSKNLAQ